MATILANLQAVCDEANEPQVSAYDDNRQLLALLESVSRELRQLACFPQQKRSYSFNTSASDAEYALPADYYMGIQGTYYDQTRAWSLIGPLSDSEWNYRQYGPGSASNTFAYRVFGPDIGQYSSSQQFELDPTPAATIALSFDYITSRMFYESGFTPTTTTKETVGADTDVSMFDDDILIAGTLYRYLEIRKKDYADAFRRYQKLIERAKTRHHGSFKGSFARGRRGVRRYYPTEGWGGWSL